MKATPVESCSSEKVNAVEQKYCLLKNVGAGGMGCIDLIKDNLSLRKVVKKTLAEHLNDDPESIIRFIDEAQLTAQLQHPNIIPVYELAVTENDFFYTMKEVEGESLGDVLLKLSNKNEEYLQKYNLITLLEVFIKVCNAMEYACSKMVLHRDLKPENIMIGNYGEVLLIDWGLAKILGTQDEPVNTTSINSFRHKNNLNLTDAKGCIGTPLFMPPERLMKVSDERGEVYSLGAVLYNILNLKAPSVGENLEEILKNKLYGVLPEFNSSIPHSPNSEIPQQLIKITEKAIAATPEERYSSVKEFREDIERWLNGFPTIHEENNLSLQLALFYRRHRKDLNLALCCILLLVLLAGYLTFELKSNIATTKQTTAVALVLTETVKQNSSELNLQQEKLSRKIIEFKETTPSLYQNALNLRQNFRIAEALQTIKAAIKIEALPEYLFLEAFLLQVLGEHETANKRLVYLTEAYPQEENYQVAKKDAERLKGLFNDKEEEITQYIFFYKQLMKAERTPEAIFVLKKLPEGSIDKELKEAWLRYLKTDPVGKLLKKEPERLEITQGRFKLDLSQSQIVDLSSIKNMPLENLDLSRSAVFDLSPLETMEQLETLKIDQCTIGNLRPLKNLQIKFFSALDCPLKDLGGLQNKTLKYLYLRSDSLFDFSGLKGSQVEFMFLTSKAKSLRTLKGVKIRNLVARNCTELNDISGLELSSLRELVIHRSKIRSLGPLRGGKLTRLEIGDSLVTDLSPLSAHELRYLNINRTRVGDLSVLKGMPLERLSLHRCSSIRDISVIKDLKRLHTLQLPNNSLDISFIKKIPSIKKIGIRYLMNPERFWKIYSK